MRKLLLCSIAYSIALVAFGCSHTERARDADTVAEKAHEDRVKAKAKMDEQVAAVEADMKKLDDKAHRAAAEGKADAAAGYEKSKEELRKMGDDLKVARDKAANATDEAWEDTKSAFRTAYEKTRAKMKEVGDALH